MEKAAAAMALRAACSGIEIQDYTHTVTLLPPPSDLLGGPAVSVVLPEFEVELPLPPRILLTGRLLPTGLKI